MTVNNIFLALALCVSMASDLLAPPPPEQQGVQVKSCDCGEGSNGEIPSWFSDSPALLNVFDDGNIELIVFAESSQATQESFKQLKLRALKNFLRLIINGGRGCPTKITIYHYPPSGLMDFLVQHYENLDSSRSDVAVTASKPKRTSGGPVLAPGTYKFQGPPGLETFSKWLYARGAASPRLGTTDEWMRLRQQPAEQSGGQPLPNSQPAYPVHNNKWLCCFAARGLVCTRKNDPLNPCTFRHEPDDGKTPCGFGAKCNKGHADRAPFCCEYGLGQSCLSLQTQHGLCLFRHSEKEGICSTRFRKGDCPVHPDPNAAAPNPSPRVAGPPA